MEKLFYPHGYTPDKEPMRGTVISETQYEYVIVADGGDEWFSTGDGGTFTKLKTETRDPWEPHMWEFYKADGFYKSIWLHGGFIAWFFLFIY